MTARVPKLVPEIGRSYRHGRTIRVLEDATDKRQALSGLLQKYFPQMKSGEEYRPITDEELKRTSVDAISIESWSGKRNWPQQADQSDEWQAHEPAVAD